MVTVIYQKDKCVLYFGKTYIFYHFNFIIYILQNSQKFQHLFLYFASVERLTQNMHIFDSAMDAFKLHQFTYQRLFTKWWSC